MFMCITQKLISLFYSACKNYFRNLLNEIHLMCHVVSERNTLL